VPVSGNDDQLNAHQIDAIRGTFDRHGYGFQYAVAKECARLRNVGESTWWLDATEFPVEVHSTHLHIDIVLRNPGGLMVLECKRANPAISIWAFGRSQDGVRIDRHRLTG
jgi:hypothetical protein